MTPARSNGVLARNQEAFGLASCPALSIDTFREALVGLCRAGARPVALFALGSHELAAVLARDHHGELVLLRAHLGSQAYPSLTPDLPALQAFERELCEVWQIRPEGHPWLKPIRRHADLEHETAPGATYPFFAVNGSGLHEVAVGPVHAGIIEPGHFRFQCAGEQVLFLEIQLGYQHRGLERLMLDSPQSRRVALAESIAGDTAIGHATAYCAAVESLSDVEPPLRAQAIRGIALEAERLANHIGDLGALCGDVGYLPGASWLGRLRAGLLNVLFELSGSRMGRSLIRPGGVSFDVSQEQASKLLARVCDVEPQVLRISSMLLAEPTVASRFERAGLVEHDVAEALGLVGPVARASGCDRDVRRDHATGIYRFAYLPVAVADSGDVMARALVRSVEIRRSFAFLREQLQELPSGPTTCELAPASPEHLVVSLVEGWRGEIAHMVWTDREGQLAGYKVVDPSFHNWFGLAMALRGQPISDFPLCNKSFNLSYAGHDL